jgi:PelA/Pel-15E family pectate lyase
MAVVGASALSLLQACAGSEGASHPGTGGTGTTGVAGAAGSAGTGGGSGGSTGAAGTSGGGSAGSVGPAGSGGSTGAAGTGGATGTAGATGGAGAGGSTGAAGSGGAGGAGGAGRGGSGGATAGAGGRGGAAGGAAGAAGSSAVTLDQTGSPLTGIVTTYTSWLSTVSGDAAKLTADKTLADNMITWQMPHGGFYKNDKSVYAAPWNRTDARSGWLGANNVELGTIDNGGTVTETMFLADVYRRSSDTKYRDAARKALEFLLTMQYPSGGFPQVYPARPGTYSNYVTFNDDAMVRVLGMMEYARQMKLPLVGDIFTADELARISAAIAKAIDYIEKSQIVQNGVKTVWCAQHEQTTYAPMGARSYELPSKSGEESIGVIAFLMSQPQTSDVKAAAQAAIAWYKSDAVKVANTAYVSRPSGSTDDNYNPIQTRAGSTMWYRFYDLDKDVGFFSGRLPTDNPPGEGKQYDIMKIEPERRYGYQWGGSYGTSLFSYTDRVGY